MSEYRTCAELEQEGFVTECVWSSCIYAMKCQRRCDPTDDESPRPAAPRGTGRGEVTRITLTRDIDGYTYTDHLTIDDDLFYDWLTVERLKPGRVDILVDGKPVDDAG